MTFLLALCALLAACKDAGAFSPIHPRGQDVALSGRTQQHFLSASPSLRSVAIRDTSLLRAVEGTHELGGMGNGERRVPSSRRSAVASAMGALAGGSSFIFLLGGLGGGGGFSRGTPSSSSESPLLSLLRPPTAEADVSTGTEFSQAITQFQQLTETRNRLAKISADLKARQDEPSADEWKATGKFLKEKLLKSDEILNYLCLGIGDPDRQVESREVIKAFKKEAIALQIKLFNKPSFVSASEGIVAKLDKFFELLSDVPEEL
uniref:Uncharacterized protein n=1 Tax=Chromera velia CCMP2878 TaxID=1169474 RepID=A0A0G4H118_9ALVE|mmetsp:Transcript_17130/g.34747  ORF Transcript_17130/g.34747 Transcript_17130/m.34747 type:complete len:263 (-) Transcript_17130:172-960(-)|eukprot:Cvel_5529.t1-p1 / transcript=Cvel_5529.t1 / gene=Cvel_5529 / organism=Chromera_velia_CCMP2878 / gene_product=hypothetical protein / transcript_product=hypothetical protein / location=Cvel_scaffold259:41024-44598(-) / protein_length=262 / sequence_SO=supercontig / SO=protein_coding / is_pseudo=false